MEILDKNGVEVLWSKIKGKFATQNDINTLWSICKEKFALTGHTHNYAGSRSPGGSANSAIGVVDYNNTDKTIQIGYSGAGITGDQIKHIAGYTYGSGNVDARIKDVSKDALKSWLGLGSLAYNSSIDWSQISRVPTATTTQSGIMSAADKAKLNGIASGANNYTLPTASDTTLGGIKVSTIQEGTEWPISVDRNGIANTYISGLNKLDNYIGSVTIEGQSYRSTYYEGGVNIINKDDLDANDANIAFPHKSGTFALLSDIPNASNLCKFNFVNSISDCVNGRINFLFKNSDDYVDLSFLNNLEEGTILLIYCPHTGFQITYKPSNWYYNGTNVAAYNTMYVDRGRFVLAFFYNIYVYVSTFAY